MYATGSSRAKGVAGDGDTKYGIVLFLYMKASLESKNNKLLMVKEDHFQLSELYLI